LSVTRAVGRPPTPGSPAVRSNGKVPHVKFRSLAILSRTGTLEHDLAPRKETMAIWKGVRRQRLRSRRTDVAQSSPRGSCTACQGTQLNAVMTGSGTLTSGSSPLAGYCCTRETLPCRG
jgi:hypothetical protein